jgi:PAS domain S-box-containing protein
MKITTRFLYLDILFVAITIATVAVTFLVEIHREAESRSLTEQEQHLKTFWALLKTKGEEFRIVDGKLLAGKYVVNESNELPDQIRDIFGCTATVFMGDKRISTNVLKADGSRAIGTRLQGPAFDAIFRQGKPYRGEALILGIPYFTAYDPIRNGMGEIIGALYVGVKKSTYFATYEKLMIKVVILTTILTLLFSLLTFLLISFRRKADKALKDSEETLRSIANSARDAIVMIDDQGKITFWNASAVKMLGWDQFEVLGRDLHLILAPQNYQSAYHLGMQHFVKTGQGNAIGKTLELPALRKDNTEIPVELSLSSVKLGDHWHGIGIIRDITKRKLAEEVLRESEERLKLAMDIAKLAQWEYDVNTEMFNFDDQFYALYGTTTELEGGPLMSAEAYARKFIPPDEAPIVAAEISKALAITDPNITSQLDHRIIRADGEERFIVVRYKVIHDRDGNVIKTRGTNQDITERKKAEESLCHLNRTLRTLTKCNETLVRAENESDLLHDICRVIVEEGGYRFAWVGYADYDEARSVRPVAHAGYEEGYLETLNITWADTGRGHGPSGTAIRTELPSYIKDIRRDPSFAIWRDEAVKRGYMSSLAIPIISAGQIGSLNIYASEPDVFDEQEIELMVQLANDMAYGIKSLRTREKHKQTTEALCESLEEYRKLAAARDQERNLLRALIDSIPDLIFFKDHASVYLGCNKAFEAFAGRTENDLIGLTDLDMFPREVGELFRETDRQMMAHRMSRRNEEWVDYQDGRHVFLETLKTPFYDQNGKILGLIGISRDITERNRAEEEHKKLEVQLQQAQKMEAIGLLAGGIAHDFNNILTAIIGYSEIISMRMEKDSPLRHYVDQVKTSSERAAELTASLLAFSRKQVLHIKPIDLCEVVRGLKKMLGRIIREDIVFQTKIIERDLIVQADKVQIEQVLMNLVTNAKDAMPKGGSLAIEVYPALMDNRFVHSHGFGEPGNYACISVADTGHGMDEETRKRIFEPFYTTKEVGKGTGLGMAIIYGIIKQHNGYINFYSEPDRGTTFRIYLPLIAGEEIEDHDAQNTEPPAGGTEIILLAEDDETVRELHTIILEEAGYTVIEAVDGQDALTSSWSTRQR